MELAAGGIEGSLLIFAAVIEEGPAVLDHPAAMRSAGREPRQSLLCACGESQENLQLMRWIDEQYTATPYFGSRRMAPWLREHKKTKKPTAVAL